MLFGVLICLAGPAAFATGPHTNNDSVVTDEDTEVSFDPLANDSDIDGDPFILVDHENPKHGTLSLNGTTFTYTPDPDFTGKDHFDYSIRDQPQAGADGTADQARTTEGTVVITVNPVDDAPVANDDVYLTDEDTVLAPEDGVFSNDSDADGDDLTGFVTVQPTNGTLVFNTVDGTFTYTPNLNFNGLDSFTYGIIDGTGLQDNATVVINVSPVNDDPVAVNDSYTVAEDTTLSVAAPGVLANDTDIDAGANLTATLATGPATGTLTFNGDGSFTYVPVADASGDVTFTYTVFDGVATSAFATVTISVGAVNDAPTADDISVTVAEDSIANIDVAASISDVENDTLTVTVTTPPVNGQTVDPDPGGTVIEYQSAPDFSGTDTFIYTVTDGNGGAASATVTVTVTPVPDTPKAIDDTYTVNKGGNLDVAAPQGVLANDQEVDVGETLTAVLDVAPANDAAFTFNADGSFSYTPDPTFEGTDTFTYHVTDGALDSASATVSIVVNLPPVAVDDAYEVDEDTTLTVDVASGVLANDSDPENDVLKAVLEVAPTKGTLQLAADGSFVYTPNANENGTDTFTYQARTGGNADSNTATVTITINSVNDAPVAVDDSAATDEDTGLSIDVTDNDTDDGDAIVDVSLTITQPPANGDVVNNGDGTVYYTPDPDFFGVDSFKYQVSDDEQLTSNTATVTVTVGSANDAPVANADAVTTDENTAVAISVLANDSDVDGVLNIMSLAIVGAPSSGTAAIGSGGTITYTPDTAFDGTDTFTYTVDDNKGLVSNVATVTVTVVNVIAGPVALDDSGTTVANVAVTIDVTANDGSDTGTIVDASVTIVQTPGNGTVISNGDGTVDYVPNATFFGLDSFTYTVQSSEGATSNVATVLVTVNAFNETPVAVNDSVTTGEGTPINIAVLANDSDDGLLDAGSVTILDQPNDGDVVVNGDGTVTYTPDDGFDGVDTFTYIVDDNLGESSNEATVSVTVTDAPTAAPNPLVTVAFSVGTAQVNESFNVLIYVQENAIEANGFRGGPLDVLFDNLLVAFDGGFDAGSIVQAPYNTSSDLLSGTLQASHIDELGGLTTDGTGMGEGTPVLYASIPFVATAKGTAAFSTAAGETGLSLTPPVGLVDSSLVSYGSASLTIINAGDFDGDNLVDFEDLTAFIAHYGETDADASFDSTYDMNNDGAITFTDLTILIGLIDTSYGGGGRSGGARATGAGTPTAADDVFVAVDGEATDLDVLDNDSDPDDPLLITSVTQPAGDDANVEITPDGDGLVFQSEGGATGSRTFTYTLTDPDNDSVTATVVVYLIAANDPPTANDDAATTEVDTDVDINVLANDTDSDGVIDVSTVEITAAPDNGGTTVNGDGSVTYSPGAGFVGTDRFRYLVRDTQGGISDEAEVVITVTDLNAAPVAGDDTDTVAEDSGAGVNVDVVDNDSDADGTLVNASVVIVSQGTNGIAVSNGDGTVNYVPNADFSGVDTFTYSIDDNDGDTSNAATVSVTVTPSNDDPTANDDLAVAADGATITIDVLANDNDPDGDPLIITAVTQPTNGQVTIANDGSSVSFTTVPNTEGQESFTYTIDDRQGGATDTATVRVQVFLDNAPPTAVNDSASTDIGVAAEVDVLANDSDSDGAVDATSVTIVDAAENGATSVNGTTGVITYTPVAGFSGTDTFGYIVRDDENAISGVASVTVTVADGNAAPAAADDSGTVAEDSVGGVDINVVTNDSDSDGTLVNASVAVVAQGANGMATSNGDGTITYVPNADFSGTDTFTYTVDDNDGATSNAATVTVTVSGSNDDPVAVDDLDVAEDGQRITIDVIANDSDADGDSLLITAVTQPTNGQVGIANNGTAVTFVSVQGTNGEETFTYTIDDRQGGATDTATVRVQVFLDNAPPVAADDTASTDIATAVVVDVVANDTDSDGTVDATTVTIINAAENGTTSVNGTTGAITYTPAGGFEGTDIFGYVVRDNDNGISAQATVTVTVADSNQPPVADDDADTVAEDSVAGVDITVVTNDSDADGTLVNASVAIASQGSDGTATANGDGTVTYIPNADFSGTDSFTYTVDDNDGAMSNAATVTVNVTPSNDDPVAVDDAAVATDEQTITIDVLVNDSDVDGDSLLITAVTQPANGQVVIVNNGQDVTFTAVPGTEGQETFTYTIDDLQGGTTQTATVNVQVFADNTPPSAADDNAVTDVNTAVVVDVAANDSDSDGTVDVTTVTVVNAPENGATVVSGTTGEVTYTPAAGFSGTDTFGYIVRDDDNGISSQANVTVTVNQPPVAVADSASTDEDVPVTINVVANDTDADGSLDLSSVTIVTPAASGTTTVNGDGTVTYTPDAGSTADDSFTYTIDDSLGSTSNTATVDIAVANVIGSPVAADDADTTTEDTSVQIDLTDNDGTESGTIVDASVSITGDPANGSVVNNGNGTVDYTPDDDFFGIDTFSYTVQNSDGSVSNVADVQVTVTSENDAPNVANDSATTAENTAVTITVLGNDDDVDGTLDVATVTIVDPVDDGATIINADGSVTYTPDNNFDGTDMFTYTVADNLALTSAQATVTITVVDATNDPVAVDDTAVTVEDNAVSIDLTDNDAGGAGTVVDATVTIVRNPSAGSLVNNGDGTVHYTPTANTFGMDTFTYTIRNDNGVLSNTATVQVTVTSQNDAPIAAADSASTAAATSVTISVLANDSDVDGTIDTGTVEIVADVGNGTVINNGDGTMTYTSDGGFDGTDTFTYTVKDNLGLVSAPGTVTINVASTTNSLLAVQDEAVIDEDESTTIDLLANDVPGNGDIIASSLTILQQPFNGTAINNGDGTVTYFPDENVFGIDVFAYLVVDDTGAFSNVAQVRIQIDSVNDAPDVKDDSATTDEGVAVVIELLDNDDDVDGVIDPTSVTVTDPANGAVAVDDNGDATYTPDDDFVGTDTFTYTVDDNLGDTSAVATVTVEVGALTSGPVASDDTAETSKHVAVVIDLTANDSSRDGDILDSTVAITQDPTMGTVGNNDDGSVIYVPFAGFTGIDTFFYTVQDSTGETSNEAKVSVTVSTEAAPEEEEPDEPLIDVVVEFSTSSVNVGESFDVMIYVTETSAEAAGFRGGAFDLLFNSSRVEFDGAFDPLSIMQGEFDNSPDLVNGSLEGSRIDELGGLTTTSGQGDGVPVLYAVIPFVATAEGTVTFTSRAGDGGMSLAPPVGLVDGDGISFGGASIEISYRADFDGDEAVTFNDLTDFIGHYGETDADPTYDGSYDLDNDGDIDFADLTAIIALLGTDYNGGARSIAPSAARSTQALATVILEGPTQPVATGDVFEVRVYVQEDDPAAPGFRAGPIDIEFSAAMLDYSDTPDSDTVIQDPFRAIETSGTFNPGHIDELGGAYGQNDQGNGTPVLYAVIEFVATASGVANISAAPGEIGLALSGKLLEFDEIDYGTGLSIEITDGAAGGGDAFTFEMDLTNVQVEDMVLTIGMDENATDGYNSGIDEIVTTFSIGQLGIAYIDNAVAALMTDKRAISSSASWHISVSAADDDVTISWNPAELPAAGLHLREADANGNILADGLSVDMADQSSVVVPAGTATDFVLTYGYASFNLTINQGWSLLSVPIDPLDPAVHKAFGREHELPIWEWTGTVYKRAESVRPGQGYWVYRIEETTDVEVRGQPIDNFAMQFGDGWSLAGPVVSAPFDAVSLPFVPDSGSVEAPIWKWNGSKYSVADSLVPGNAYWIFSIGGATVTFD
jgi:hypothetical protein